MYDIIKESALELAINKNRQKFRIGIFLKDTLVIKVLIQGSRFCVRKRSGSIGSIKVNEEVTLDDVFENIAKFLYLGNVLSSW